MYGYILQDWITIRSTQSGVNIIQSEAGWMSFQTYGDIVLWLDTKAVTLAGLTSLTIAYETSPAKDDSLFTPMVAAVTLVAGTSPLITPALAHRCSLSCMRRVNFLASDGPISGRQVTIRTSRALRATPGGSPSARNGLITMPIRVITITI